MKHYYTPQSTISDKVNKILTLAFYDRTQKVVIGATLGSNQSERSKFGLDQSESRIWPM